ncbi:conserved hypothetical protein [Uncinocarpus reesii 1704]|uniref:Ras-GEF domain-containing protein n=1 Tax=Uncinocarpus reesii (strain UAMH 1704) TaxID=336963 RepID=C4JVK1_UNCRE|nr:uncharacterized protein UREG_06593 [Uncinocarpus reesii 1704]EEP81728.1 conserved hypothetical protein [Uncinocarpus reesii 1704]
MLNVLAQWVAEYPGDFASAMPRKQLTEFISHLEKNIVFAFAAKEMSSSLEKFVEDDDASWAVKEDKAESENVETFLDTSAQSSPATSIIQSTDDNVPAMTALDLNEEIVDHESQYSNISTASTLNRSGSISSQSFKTLLNIETAQREAQRLEIIPRHNLGKTQWRIFMEIPDEDFARELTRIDWVMYTAFRPRELIRHKLRQLFNYNSLGAIIAGLNGTPIFRLAQTRELVSHNVQKQFMSLVILMGTQKSHFAYRLAWENSFGERIPFLPLHLRDLVSAEEGNKTFVGDRINWRKFEIMGDVILGIQQSQRTPFPSFHINEIVRRLVLGARFEGDDESKLAG